MFTRLSVATVNYIGSEVVVASLGALGSGSPYNQVHVQRWGPRSPQRVLVYNALGLNVYLYSVKTRLRHVAYGFAIVSGSVSGAWVRLGRSPRRPKALREPSLDTPGGDPSSSLLCL